MRSFTRFVAVSAVAVLALCGGMVGTSHADSFQVADVGWDSSAPGGGAGVSYSSVTKLLSSNATGVDIFFAGGVPPKVTLSGATLSYSVTLSSFSNNGTIASGSGSGGSFSVDDGGVNLLTGSFQSLTISAPDGGGDANVSALVNITGGFLFTGGHNATLFPSFDILPSFVGGGIFLPRSTISFNTTFSTGNDFSSLETSPITGGEKGDLKPVPEPGSLLLLGSGLVALGLAARRKKNS